MCHTCDLIQLATNDFFNDYSSSLILDNLRLNDAKCLTKYV